MLVNSKYNSYMDFKLDMKIFQTVILNSQVNLSSYKEEVLRELEQEKPIKSFDSIRYQLSDLVSADYVINYNNDLELSDTELVVDFDEIGGSEEYDIVDELDFDTEEVDNVRSRCIINPETSPLSIDRIHEINEAYSKFLDSELEDFNGNIAELEERINNLMIEDDEEVIDFDNDTGTAEYDIEDEIAVNVDDNIEMEGCITDLSDMNKNSNKGYSYDDDEDINEEYNLEEDTNNHEGYSDEDLEDEYFGYSDDEEDEDEYTDDYKDSEDEDKFIDNDEDSEEDEDEYIDNDEESEDEDEYDGYSDDEDEDEDEYIAEDEDSQDEEEYSEDEEDEYSDYDEDLDEDEYIAEDDNEDSDEDEDDYSEEYEGNTGEDDDEIDAFLDTKNNKGVDEQKTESSSEIEIDNIDSDSVDDFEPEFIDIDTAKEEKSDTEIKKEVVKEVKKEETVKEEEPKDLIQFIRKHPRCEVSFALQYFSKKEIEKNIMMGRIIKKGNKLYF